MKCFEADQWTAATAIRQGVTIEQLREQEGEIRGGDADSVRAIFGGGRLREIDVPDGAYPSIGRAWLLPDLTGKLIVYRANYDSSG